MRQCLLFGGLEVIVYNLNRKVNDIKLFELGKVYSKILDIEPSEEVTKKIQ